MKKKAEVRKKMKDSLKRFPLVEKARQTNIIMGQFHQSEGYKRADIIGAFVPLSFEFDITELLADQTKRIVIPKVLDNHQMIFTDYDEEKLVKTSFGVYESTSLVAVIPDLIIVPALAWSLEGYRIGFGGGYYDRYLSNFKGETNSFAYDFQIISDFQPEPFDIPISKIFKV